VTFKEKVTVGATLPADVRLSPVPADWGPSVSKYQYGGDTRPRRSPLTGVYRRGDDMAPLIVPQEEYVRMRHSRQW
jgi:hypothetical protein